jgi:hypothetical protein
VNFFHYEGETPDTCFCLTDGLVAHVAFLVAGSRWTFFLTSFARSVTDFCKIWGEKIVQKKLLKLLQTKWIIHHGQAWCISEHISNKP